MPIVFNVQLLNSLSTARSSGHYSHHINSFTANMFSECYSENAITASIAAHDPCTSPYELISLFNTSCSAILETVAPLKFRRSNFKPQQWLDVSTRHLRQVCRRAERKWKKDHLPFSLEIFRNSLSNFQAAAKNARAKHFSDIISKHSNRPRILFNTINSIVNPQVSPEVEASTNSCEEFLKFFIEKIDHIRAQFTPVVSDTSPQFPIPTATFDRFQAVSCTDLWDIVKHMKPSTAPHDPIPSQITKDAFDAIGPSIQLVLNSCLACSCMFQACGCPAYAKET